jgi:hypothetical protein
MTITNISIFLLAIYIIYILLDYGLYFIISPLDKETFVDNYYQWNWNNPHVINYMNTYTNNNSDSINLYSQSCHLTDDAQPFCYKSKDIPKYNNNNNIFIRNSF